MRAPALSLVLLAGLLPLSAGRGAEDVIDSPMYNLPELPSVHVEVIYSGKSKDLWLQALERPSAETRSKAASTITLAKRRGVKGIETTVAPLRKVLDRPEQHPAVRLAIVEVLIALDDRESAPSLFRHAQADGGDLRDVAEPALARWDHRPVREVWLERLRNFSTTRRRDLTLAIQGLLTVREERAAAGLRELVFSKQAPSPVRVQAARALGLLRPAGLEKDARVLAGAASKRGLPSRLAAVALLRKHRGKEAVDVLQGLMKDQEPSVVAPAVERLLEIDPKLTLNGLGPLLKSSDAKLRSLGVEAMFREANPERIRLLGDRLDDDHPDVRGQARRALRELAKPKLAKPKQKAWREPVIAAGMKRLTAKDWRGQEQATILLTHLDHKPAAPHLVELLKENRPEVFITAAWGLRNLAVPETFEGILRYLEAERALQYEAHPDRVRAETSRNLFDYQLSQLNQLFGQQKYAPADRALRPLVGPPNPKDMFSESRAAAIWALGMIHEGKKVTNLVTDLEARLNDTMSVPPEMPRVRRMCAITLGRLKATEALPSLRKNSSGERQTGEAVHNATAWAIEKATGKPLPTARPIRRVRNDWFLIWLDLPKK